MKLKLSFKTAKKPAKITAKRAFNDEEENRSTSTLIYITEFDPTKTLTSSTKTLIIPPLQNQLLHPSKRTKNLEHPIRFDSFPNFLQFESQSKTLTDETKSGHISYGLTIGKKQPDSNGNNGSVNTEVDEREETFKGSDYEVMPAEEFAKAYFRGYGWSEGVGVGRNPRMVDIWTIEERTILGKGLGFKPDGIAKPEEPKPNSSKSVIRVGERRKVRGKEARSSRSGGKEDEKRISSGCGCAKKKGGDGKPGWLISHIRVRVISKDLEGGRLYLKKGEVVDVVGPTSCDLLMDEGRELIQGVDQELLETTLPMRGGILYVLSGMYKGVCGILVERDLDRGIGVVCDGNTHELFKVKLEQIAEYIGDPSLVGY